MVSTFSTTLFPYVRLSLISIHLCFPQLMVYVQKLITNRKVQEQQLAMANQATYLNQLALQNGMMAGGMNQMNLLGLYQRLHGMGGNQGGDKNPGPSQGM